MGIQKLPALKLNAILKPPPWPRTTLIIDPPPLTLPPPSSAPTPPTITMTDNSESELAIARAKNTKNFQKWEKLAPEDEFRLGDRIFIKGCVNDFGMADEDRLIARMIQSYASSKKQASKKKQERKKE